MPDVKIGSVVVKQQADRVERLSILLWGKPSVGKTVLASTLPGKKLWLQFDPDATASLTKRDDVYVADLAGLAISSYAGFAEGGVLEKDIHNAISASDADTIVVDSLTSYAQTALAYVVQSGRANGANFKASVEQPGQAGYGLRNGFVMSFCNSVIRTCANLGKHVIFILHEREKYDKDGKSVTGVTISVGGQVENNLPLKISEVWMMMDNGKQRLIYVRPHSMWSPMRTRMFKLSGDNKFVFTYDQETGNGTTIEEIYNRWKSAGFNKIDLPT
jgi:hypothetical protein